MGNINSKFYGFIKGRKSEKIKNKANENSKNVNNKKKKSSRTITYKLYEDNQTKSFFLK